MADKIHLPSSGGGLVNYSGDATGSKFPIKPEYAVGFIISVIILIAVLTAIY